MSLRAAARCPGPFPAARPRHDGTGRTEPAGAARPARGADLLAGRYPDGRVPTPAETQVNASCEGHAPCRRRPRQSPPLPGAPEAFVQWSAVDDEYGTARPWMDRLRSPRTDVLTTTEVSRTGNEPPPWRGTEADRRGTEADRRGTEAHRRGTGAAHRLPTRETP
ncbi:hypothetical protein [Streptomyces griseorubiginosus]|uniref:hypothetical protein n=1 Tax=Streptomyces griseorubiginosus TaxID=67304 RepID=UPI0011401225|nr:hypothetical protein [Streptomyces griseorubiginosus]